MIEAVGMNIATGGVSVVGLWLLLRWSIIPKVNAMNSAVTNMRLVLATIITVLKVDHPEELDEAMKMLQERGGM